MRREPRYKDLDIFRSKDVIYQSNQFTVMEQKLVLTAIAQHRKSDSDFFEYEFNPKELAELFDISLSNIYKPLKDACTLLVGRSMGYIDDKNEKFALYPLMASAEFKDGICKLSFNSKLKPLLLDISEQYSIIQLNTMAKLKTRHAIRLYELIMVGQNKYNKRGVWEMKFASLEDFKDLMGLYTIPNKKEGKKKYRYPQYKDLKRYTLTPAIREITDLTDIKLTIEPIVKSKKTVGLIFHAEKKEGKLTNISKRISRDDLDSFYSRLSDKQKEEVNKIVDKSFTQEPGLGFLEEMAKIGEREKIALELFGDR